MTHDRPAAAARSVNDSRTTLTELMIPSYANFGGKIHGGILLSLMDKVAYACASKHSGAYCVTVSVDNVDFMQPVEVGELVSLRGSVNYVGKSSMVVGIRVTAENVVSREVKHTNTSYFTMVAKGADGKPFEVPPLILESQEDVRRFVEARERRRIYFQSRELMQQAKQQFNWSEEAKKLKGERCRLKLKG
ncbi:acyl-CoA thioesterase [Cesiribacter andamanensis]|uniref:Putative acyl-CoA thioester hydrolase n=1 Tax=Cesiribacter andamanensis AMV16 TaxID=1279009 RepID=M7N863_9BACT|nr:acyl-CoA thioesterase [Cesiribacter andamanensis]EMR03401.1 putative acyl-CoA thioester hydrolase [Cesiribacter andamanensis AMV16]